MKKIRPMLATLSKEVVSGPGWVYEEKYDGIRLVAHRERGKVRLDSRNLIDRTASFQDATWVRPRLVGQVAYAEWTTDGKLRQPAFLGLRTDKAAREVRWAERE